MHAETRGATLFVDGRSRLHRLHPLSKLAFMLFSGVAAYLAPGGWPVPAALLALNVCLLLGSGTAARAWPILWRVMLPLAVFMVPIHGLLHPDNATVAAAWHGLTVYREGLIFASLILLRLAVLLSASLIFVLSTHPADILTMITQAGWPPALAYLLGSPLLMLPAMRERVRTIQAAQRARGMNSDGNLLQRMRGVAPLIIPFTLGALMEIEQRAVALEVRGFNSPTPKTAWREVSDTGSQRALRWLLLAACVALIVYRAVA